MTDIISSPIADINFADFAVFADMYNDTGEKWNIYTDENNDHPDYDDSLYLSCIT